MAFYCSSCLVTAAQQAGLGSPHCSEGETGSDLAALGSWFSPYLFDLQVKPDKTSLVVGWPGPLPVKMRAYSSLYGWMDLK